MTTTARDTWLLSARAFREGVRNPVVAFLFPTVFPLFMIWLTSESFREIVNLPGFPITPYSAYIAPAIVLLAAMMGAGSGATSLILDAQTGFLDRLRLLPIRPAAILLGRLVFDAVRVLPAGIAVILVSLALDARLDHGVTGALAVLGLLMLWSVAYNGVFYLVALVTRNAQAPIAVIPMFMPLMFLSTAFLPEQYLPAWIRTAAEWNPYDLLIRAARPFMTGEPTWEPVAEGLAAAIVVLLISQLVVAWAFSRLLRAD
ncbi:MAG: ABC transporter permease [Nitriliruptorales bacterium]